MGSLGDFAFGSLESRLDFPARNTYICVRTLRASDLCITGHTSMRSIVSLLLVALVFAGCDNSAGPDTSRGSAPVITNFTFSPESTAYYPWGDSVNVRGSISFTDMEGDLATLLLSIAPGGKDTLDVSAATGIRSGQLAGVFRVATGAVGSYNVTATLIDSKGNRSNPTSKIFRVARDGSGAIWGYRPSGTTMALSGIAASDSLLVAVGVAGTILSSRDGRVWETRTSGTGVILRAVTWSGQEFIAVGDNCTILASPDAVTWTPRNAGRTDGTLNGVTSGGGLVVAVGGNPMMPGTGTDSTIILTSPDGTTWTERGTGLQWHTLQGIAWSGIRFVATAMKQIFSTDVVVLTSSDGLTWARDTLPGLDYSIFDITWTGTSFVTAGTGEASFVSSDGTAWQRYTLDATHQYGIASSGGPLVTVGWNILTSHDGRTWDHISAEVPQRFQHVIWHDFQYIAVGENGTILVSPPGGV